MNFVSVEQLTHQRATPEQPLLANHWIERFLDTQDLSQAIQYWVEFAGIKSKEEFFHSILSTIEQIDAQLNQQLDDILHHSVIQRLESTWRGLRYLVEQKDSNAEELVKIKILTCTWDELVKDATRAIEFDQSALFKLIYQNEYSMPGGEPFGLLVGDYYLGQSPERNAVDRDIRTLGKMAQSAAAAFSPFIMSVSPSVFGTDHFSDIASIGNIYTQFEQSEYLNWRKLRESDDVRFIGLTMPNVLYRQPYCSDGSRSDQFVYNERIRDSNRDLLWGNASFCFAAVIMRAFQENGWFTHIRGHKTGDYSQGIIQPPSSCRVHLPGKGQRYKAPLNLKVTERREQELSDCGFIPLSPVAETQFISFTSNISLHQSRLFSEKGANVNARLSSMLQYTLCVSRIAHYIKVMGRDRVGSYQDAQSIERDFQAWLHKYTTASDEASDELRAKYPLNEARIRVTEKLGSPGNYYSVIHLRPHFQLDQMVSSIKLITELSPEHIL
ncbi:type VI secretion system contractile sheath large subunit [Vibrio cincinnatiensis]|uniref:type VI secretion system contractile sheath large subunit n=1 Tax=Vibrio cincinnatiensis TaxID=675 RepID=UPI001EE0298A|nr:type VI secretion system contractile sheath large subunit [Vibrio cincinnatiensis]MCG3726262.1 type VI secretion system contractile sheath large subunit [Vibrio cincinnatiensis]MCG3733395.1 type VI secretion system contractile sheath large subunit [Vibrio cincinnatiensis]MCG3740770.1 type VI secretion system contractile sheath large subunit [Vibrio cincinnatiensis]MCG3744256.1 type VI secretion system contractile sheath large subunit [Vibrio cincinnatiensis]